MKHIKQNCESELLDRRPWTSSSLRPFLVCSTKLRADNHQFIRTISTAHRPSIPTSWLLGTSFEQMQISSGLWTRNSRPRSIILRAANCLPPDTQSKVCRSFMFPLPPTRTFSEQPEATMGFISSSLTCVGAHRRRSFVQGQGRFVNMDKSSSVGQRGRVPLNWYVRGLL
jgi:hypothetical protein